MKRLVVCVLVAGCSGELPPNGGGNPFWVEVDTTGGTDLGHTVERVDGAPAQMLDFRLVTDEAGLGGAASGGNTHGVGIAFVDLTGDDWPDIFVASGVDHGGTSFPPSFWVNQGDGTFVNRTAEAGFDVLGNKNLFSVAAADYDSDGDIDLYLGESRTDILMTNAGDGTFTDVTTAAGAGGPPSEPELFGDGRSKVVAFGDFDGDGHLDIVSASSALPAEYAYLLRNDGDGTFTDITESSGVFSAPSGNPCAVLWSDYDADGDQDLWIWNDRGDHVLLDNEDGTRFSDVTERASDVSIRHPMGIDGADIDHDGDLDYYVSNIGNNPLLRNNGDGTFSDITGEAGTGGQYGWGLAFEDFDLDGWPDIFVAQEDNRPHLLFHHSGTVPPTFTEIGVRHPAVMSTGRAHNVAAGFADYDKDGRVDVVTAGTDGSKIQLYNNRTDVGGNHYLHVAVRGARRGGVTARVLVKTGDLVQFRDITGGSSRASQNEHTVRFGLGPYSGAEWVVVLWPDGEHRVWRNVEGNREITLEP